MAVTLISVTRDVPKESHDVGTLLRKLGVAVKNKQDLTLLIGDLVKALDGIAAIPEEIAQYKFRIAGDVASEVLLMLEDFEKAAPAEALPGNVVHPIVT